MQKFSIIFIIQDTTFIAQVPLFILHIKKVSFRGAEEFRWCKLLSKYTSNLHVQNLASRPQTLDH